MRHLINIMDLSVEELDDLKDDFSDTFDWDEDVDEDPDNDDGEDILENKDNIFACIDRAYNDLNEALDDLTDLV